MPCELAPRYIGSRWGPGVLWEPRQSCDGSRTPPQAFRARSRGMSHPVLRVPSESHPTRHVPLPYVSLCVVMRCANGVHTPMVPLPSQPIPHSTRMHGVVRVQRESPHPNKRCARVAPRHANSDERGRKRRQMRCASFEINGILARNSVPIGCRVALGTLCRAWHTVLLCRAVSRLAHGARRPTGTHTEHG